MSVQDSVPFTRVACYAVILDDESRILLCRLSSVERAVGQWTLPGGGIEFGEDLAEAAKREVREETGLEVEIKCTFDAHSEFFVCQERPMHAVRIVYRANVIGGELTEEVDGTPDSCQYFRLDEIESIPCVGLVRRTVSLLRDQLALATRS